LTNVVEIKCPLVLEAFHPADIDKLKPMAHLKNGREK